MKYVLDIFGIVDISPYHAFHFRREPGIEHAQCLFVSPETLSYQFFIAYIEYIQASV